MRGILSARRSLVVLVLALMISACSIGEEKRLVYRQSESIPPLQIPSGLQAPQTDEALPLYEVNPAAVAVDILPPGDLSEKMPEQMQEQEPEQSDQ